MPELPEVECSRLLLEDALVGLPIGRIALAPDDIVCEAPRSAIVESVTGATVVSAGRKGKFFWLQLDRGVALMAHLGMSGAILELTESRQRAVHYKHHMADLAGFEPEPPSDNPHQAPYVKMRLDTECGRTVVMTDARRLGRIWLSSDPLQDRRVKSLGPDALRELPSLSKFSAMLAKRKAPIKAVLLDQSFLAGIGNYLADEILYQAGVAPTRQAASLSDKECARIRKATAEIIPFVVQVEADYDLFPDSWLFHHRWGGSRGNEFIEGQAIVRETVGGRTTAWVPTRQR